MKALRVKKVVFVVLFGIAAYVWWGNIQSFSDSSEVDGGYFEDIVPKAGTKKTVALIEYRTPRTNPFRKYNVARPTNSASRAQAPVQTELLHVSHKLKGIVGRGSAAQVVVQLPNQSNRILAISDSLGSWKVKEIRDVYVTFINGKHHDTLFLETHGL